MRRRANSSIAVDVFRAAVDDGLLSFGKPVPGDDLLAERLEKLGLFDDVVK